MLRTVYPSRDTMGSGDVGVLPEDGLGDTFKLLTCSQLDDIDLYLLYLSRERTIVVRVDNGRK